MAIGDLESSAPRADRRDMATLARGGALNLIGAVAAAVGGFALWMILARGFGKDEAGAFLESVAIFNILSIAGAIGADTGLVWAFSRSLAKRRDHDLRRFVRVAALPVVAVGLISAALVWSYAPALAERFGGADHADTISSVLRVMAPMLPVASLYLMVLGASRGFSTMVPTVAVDRFGRAFFQPAVALIVAALGGSLTALAVGWSAPYLIGLVTGVAWLVVLMRRRSAATADVDLEPPRPTGALASRFWRFTAPRSVASIFRVGVQWIDVLIVGAVMSPADAAVYGFSTRLLQFGLFVASSVGQVAQPMFGGLLAAGEKARAKDVYQTATGWQVAITWPQYLAAALFGALLLRLIFGSAYVEGAPVVAILAISTMIGAAAGPVDMLLLMAGKSTWSLWNTGATLTVNVVLNLILIPSHGIVGAAVAWAISRLLANALPLAQVAGYLGLHPFGRGSLIAGAGALVIFGGLGLVAWLIDDQNVWVFLLYGATATLLYAAFLRRFRHQLHLPLAWEAFRSRRQPAAAK
jgi:O-antigen/teichoic acid export membrane protein